MSVACKPIQHWLTLVGCTTLGACALMSPDSSPTSAPAAADKQEIVASAPASQATKNLGASSKATASVPSPATAPTMVNKPVVSATVQKQFDTAMDLLKSNRMTEAQQQLLLLTKSNPELVSPWLNLGLIELRADHFEAAVEYFKQATQRDAASAVAQNYLGMGYRHLGQFKQAEAAYQAAITADANYALAYFNLGVLYDLYLQQPALAVQQYESYQALQGTPDSKVAGWIKDLKGRLGAKAKTAEAQS